MVNVNDVDDLYMDEKTYELVASDYILICFKKTLHMMLLFCNVFSINIFKIQIRIRDPILESRIQLRIQDPGSKNFWASEYFEKKINRGEVSSSDFKI